MVTLHVPETPQPRYHMIGGAQLARMKPGAGLINASRGTVVEIDALAAGAAVGAPVGRGDRRVSRRSRRRQRTRVRLAAARHGQRAAHAARRRQHRGSAGEHRRRRSRSKLIKYSNNGSTLGAVNFPEVSLPEHPGKHRLLHIHRNQPGVLSAINAVFSEEQINIAGAVPADRRQDRLRGDRHRDPGARGNGTA